ncbi:50S ribosomal L9 C-terminal domain-containing protein [Rhodopirellula sp. JC639]|uniref:50S ribosomal L9 C-terminal domain-containing protein n=1 Tax=Stieleria mannarensis TaxID=2755585 RepID=UPI00160471FE
MKGLLDGTLSPADCPGVTEWCQSEAVSPTGMDGLVYALQLALRSSGTTYVIPKGQSAPAAMLPKYVSRGQLTIVVSYVGGTPVIITSLDEFLSSNNIVDFSLETLTPSRLRRRLPSQSTTVRDREVTSSVTIEKRSNDQNRLFEPLEVKELVDAINQELGYDLTADQLPQDLRPIDQLGLYSLDVQTDPSTKKKISVWVVPSAD